MGGTDLKAERSAAVLKLIDEYTQRGQSISTSLAPQATTGVFSTLKGDPAFPPGLDRETTCQIVRDAQRLGVLVEEDYEYSRGKFKPRWRVKVPGMGADAPSETPAEPAAGSAQGEIWRRHCATLRT